MVTRAIETATRAIETATHAIEIATRAIKTATHAIKTATRAIETITHAIQTTTSGFKIVLLVICETSVPLGVSVAVGGIRTVAPGFSRVNGGASILSPRSGRQIAPTSSPVAPLHGLDFRTPFPPG